MPTGIRLIIYKYACACTTIEVPAYPACMPGHGDLYFRKRQEASVLLHLCPKIRVEAFPIFHRLTAFVLGWLKELFIRQMLGIDTCNCLEIIRLNVLRNTIRFSSSARSITSTCKDGVELPSVKRIHAGLQWPLQVEVPFRN